jgi:hypothetical protein
VRRRAAVSHPTRVLRELGNRLLSADVCLVLDDGAETLF